MRGWIFFFFTLLGWASEPSFEMHPIVLDAIRHCECLRDRRNQCNPYVIRFNNTSDILRAQAAGFPIKNRMLFCESLQWCTANAQALIDGGVINLDLGPYQINYKYHPHPDLEGYFDENRSRVLANTILTHLVQRYGYSWETLGRYHHFNPRDRSRNESYYRQMYTYIYGKRGVQE